MGQSVLDLTKSKFGRLTPIQHTEKRIRKSVVWLCKCDCGKECEVASSYLQKGKTLSCGCLLQEIRSVNSVLNSLFSSYKYHAKIRNYEFDLTKEQFEKIIQQNCHYCNKPPTQIVANKNHKKILKYNGIDRKNNSLGYVEHNSVPCCGICNDIKGEHLSEQEMLAAMKAVQEYRKQNG